MSGVEATAGNEPVITVVQTENVHLTAVNRGAETTVGNEPAMDERASDSCARYERAFGSCRSKCGVRGSW